jgi:hypothetical protein
MALPTRRYIQHHMSSEALCIATSHFVWGFLLAGSGQVTHTNLDWFYGVGMSLTVSLDGDDTEYWRWLY